MVYFVGAGPGAKDLITVRGMRLLEQADVIIYAGSLVNPELLSYAGSGAKIYDSAKMTLEEVLAVIREAEEKGLTTVRLHTGEPSLYGAVREQMDVLAAEGISYESCPGVSACFGAAADLNLEYTLPGISQSLIITRMAGRTAVPERESIESFAAHQASMAVWWEMCWQRRGMSARSCMIPGLPRDTGRQKRNRERQSEEDGHSCHQFYLQGGRTGRTHSGSDGCRMVL